MTDSVDVVEFEQNVGDAESVLQDWVTNNSVTSIDHTNTFRIGRNRTAMVIWYTA